MKVQDDSSNICKFIQTGKTNSSFNIINFVCEKEVNFKKEWIVTASYFLHLVTSGGGVLHTPEGEFELKVGDLVFLFPAQPYYFENKGELQYIYISYIGERGNSLAKRVGIVKGKQIIHGCNDLIPLWSSSVENSEDDSLDLLCEGLLLYTFSRICRNRNENEITPKEPDGILAVKLYVDSHYTDPELNIRSVSERFHYNPKYLSAAFYRLVRAHFSDYLNELRLGYAMSLIKSGMNYVKEISSLCGFGDPLYFSKSFKKCYGISPKQAIVKLRK